MTDLVKLQRVAVTAKGELVVLKIGSSEIHIGYEDALSLSQWLRVRAKEAKWNAGDGARNWRLMGFLTDLGRTRG